SASYASYKAEFPGGQYLAIAQQKLDSLNVVSQNKRQSLQSVAEVVTEAPTQVNEDTILEAQTPATPTTPTTKTTPTSKPASQTPAKTPVQQPKKTTSSPVTPPKTKPVEPVTKSDHKLALGQQHNGGIVIFINSTGEHGFVAALKEEGKYSWTAAQRRCGAYKSGGFSDWRLPTRDELGVMYDNRKHLGNYTKGIYWSGTEDGKDIAWGVNFINGSPGKFDKGSANSVWAVHPF
ncbi:MAG TPA: DUF1566 domain-containing protein, partial [Anaerolineales bacterium]|nr:DUF1566 domain-containing protein [Anaerolineales bacterium]